MRVLVVDDSALYRKIVRDALAELPDVEVVGVAANGCIALNKIDSLSPDIVTLDVEMPELDGLGVLRELQSRPSRPEVLMVSSLSGSSVNAASHALRLGAFDVIVKPSEETIEANQQALLASLKPLVAEIRQRHEAKGNTTGPTLAKPSVCSPVLQDSLPSFPTVRPLPPVAVLIGVSTGGPAALGKVLPDIPSDYPVPIIIVQHMPPSFTKSLAEQLDRVCQIDVHEAFDGQICKAGEAYIAEGGKQMSLSRNGLAIELHVNDDPPEQSCKPSVNYLFRSAATHLKGRCLAAVMTGMGDDGLIGGRLLKDSGATLIAQSADTCAVYGMPRAIIENNLADRIVPLDSIAHEINTAVSRGAIPCS